MEGANVANDHHTTDFFDYFGTNFVNIGEENVIDDICGIDETFSESMQFVYAGGDDADYNIDEISADGGTLYLVSQDEVGRGVFNIARNYRTICTSPIIGAFTNATPPSTKPYLMEQYINFFLEQTDTIEPEIAPLYTKLGSNYPNPFNPSGAGRSPSTTISYYLKNNSFTTLEIYNMLGQKVKTLVNKAVEAGDHYVVWNGLDETGKTVSSGIYFYQLKADKKTEIKKMILLR